MLAVNDVRDAWRHYLEHDNGGRGVVLIGHSQGAGVLMQLMAEEIDGKPEQEKLVSALLIGSSVSVPRGADVGSVFKSIPACRSATQTACVISYAAFRDTVPPPPDTFFGKPGIWEGPPDPNKTVICTNPSDLSGAEAPAHSYLTTGGAALGSSLAPPAWVKDGAPIMTTFVSTPGLVSTKCVSDERGTWLSVHVNGDPADPRTDDIGGDVMRDGQVVASWGLHLQDMQLAMGDLVRIVGEQAAAYKAAH
jgi:pimeloyl-ACP methyl ester carboxylesterase